MNKTIGLFVFLILIVLLKGAAFAADKVYFYHTDPAGTPIAMSDDTGAIVWKATYRPFGEEPSINPALIENNKQFVGKEKDKETSLQYFGARYMKNEIGRFLSPDPVGPVDPRSGKINQAMLTNPQRLNPYAYALNNPYRYVDSDGKWPERIHNRIIEEAFGNTASGYILPNNVRAIFKLASAHVDRDQSLEGSYMHAMRAPDMSSVEAEKKMNAFIKQKVGEYKTWMSKDNPGNAYFALGEAMHALMDSTSPSHEGFQVWQGIIPLFNSGIHATEESYISPARMDKSVKELRSFFNENK